MLFISALFLSLAACSHGLPASMPTPTGTGATRVSDAEEPSDLSDEQQIRTVAELEQQHGFVLQDLERLSEKEVVSCFVPGAGEQTALAAFCQAIVLNEVLKLGQLKQELEAGKGPGEFSRPDLEETYIRVAGIHHKVTFPKRVVTVIAVGPLHVHESPGEARHFHADHVADLNFGDDVVVCDSTTAPGAPSRRHLDVEWWQIERYDHNREPCTGEPLGWVASQEVTGDPGARCYHDLFTDQEETVTTNNARVASCSKQQRRYTLREEALAAQPEQRVATPVFIAAVQCSADKAEQRRESEFERKLSNMRSVLGTCAMLFGGLVALFDKGGPGPDTGTGLKLMSFGLDIMPESMSSPVKTAACALVEVWG